jgi:hypothetical protein
MARRWFFHEDFLDDSDTGEKAYFLGFAAADGYVHKHYLVFHLAARDKEHLARLASLIGYDGPITLKRDGRKQSALLKLRARPKISSNSTTVYRVA